MKKPRFTHKSLLCMSIPPRPSNLLKSRIHPRWEKHAPTRCFHRRATSQKSWSHPLEHKLKIHPWNYYDIQNSLWLPVRKNRLPICCDVRCFPNRLVFIQHMFWALVAFPNTQEAMEESSKCKLYGNIKFECFSPQWAPMNLFCISIIGCDLL